MRNALRGRLRIMTTAMKCQKVIIKKSRLTRSERLEYKLSDYLSQVLVGLILGDLHMRRYSSTANTRLVFCQGKNNEQYIIHLYELFKEFVSQKMWYSMVGREDEVGNKPRLQIKFATLSLPCFNYYYELFYRNKKKIIPIEIGELLTYVSLAYWLMDDGSYKANGGRHLSTEGYKEEEVKLLVIAMRKNFGIDPSIHVKNKDKGQNVIYIKKADVMRIKSKLIPYMHYSMLYKIGL